jgi:hypothetical protein
MMAVAGANIVRPFVFFGAALLVPVYVVASAAWPGLYTVDSLKQLRQAMTGSYTDVHPPIMSLLWHGLLWLTGIPASLFILQIALLGIGLLAWQFIFRRTNIAEASPFLVLAAWNPAILNFAGVVWKDVGLAVALLLGFATVAILALSHKPRWVLLAPALLFAFYASAVRWNGLPAVIPLLYLAAMAIAPFQGWRKHLAAGSLTLLCSAFFVVGNSVLTYGLLKAERDELAQVLFLYDLSGITVQTGKSVIPDEFRTDTFTLAGLRAAYTADTMENLFVSSEYIQKAPAVTVDNVNEVFGKGLKFGGPLTRTDNPADTSRLRSVWLGAIRESPGAYLRHREALFFSLLRIGYDSPYNAQVPIVDGYKLWPSRWPGSGASIAILNALLNWAKGTPLFTGWFWVVVLLTVTTGGVWVRREPAGGIAIALGASGLAYIAPYYVISVSADFRYLYWSVVAATLGTVILCGVAARKARAYFG